MPLKRKREQQLILAREAKGARRKSLEFASTTPEMPTDVDLDTSQPAHGASGATLTPSHSEGPLSTQDAGTHLPDADENNFSAQEAASLYQGSGWNHVTVTPFSHSRSYCGTCS